MTINAVLGAEHTKNKLTPGLLDKSVTLRVKKDDFHYIQYSHTSRREIPDKKRL